MVVPSEIIHVAHSKPLREYLEEVCSTILIIDPKEIWFENTLQGAVIIFAEKKRNPNDDCKGIGIKQVTGLNFLNKTPEQLYKTTNKIKGRNAYGKWTKGLLTKSEWGWLKKPVSIRIFISLVILLLWMSVS